MLDLGECQSLDVINLPSAVYLSPIQTPPPSNDGYFKKIFLNPLATLLQTPLILYTLRNSTTN